MSNSTCREEILHAVNLIVNSKGKNEFTVHEVIRYMFENNTVYKESTIKTHINSKCCINAPNHHGTLYNDFKRVEPGLYRLLK